MLKGIYGILIGMLIILSVMFGKLIISSEHKAEEEVSVVDPKYHLQLIVQNTNGSFWTSFEKGAKAAQEEFGGYIELVPLKQRTVEDLKEAVEMGVNAGVDAIALQALDSEQTQTMIDEAKEQGVAVLTYENVNYTLSETPMVGTNSYNLGSYAGNMALEAAEGQANVAVIINNAGNQGDEEYKNLLIQGILDSFSTYSTMNISNIYTIDADMFEAEKVASEIIENAEVPNLIICMDEKCTPGIAQILVDNNMVGDVKLVGYGNQSQTLDYIEHGVIYGTVCPDAYEIGYYTVKQLVQILNGEQVSDSYSTKLYTIDKTNIKKYREKTELN